MNGQVDAFVVHPQPLQHALGTRLAHIRRSFPQHTTGAESRGAIVTRGMMIGSQTMTDRPLLKGVLVIAVLPALRGFVGYQGQPQQMCARPMEVRRQIRGPRPDLQGACLPPDGSELLRMLQRHQGVLWAESVRRRVLCGTCARPS